jgi:hypothetical protein
MIQRRSGLSPYGDGILPRKGHGRACCPACEGIVRATSLPAPRTDLVFEGPWIWRPERGIEETTDAPGTGR